MNDWLVSQGGPQVAIHRKEVGVKVGCEREEDVFEGEVRYVRELVEEEFKRGKNKQVDARQ